MNRNTKTTLKVTFPDGKEICYKLGINTMTETLRIIANQVGIERIPNPQIGKHSFIMTEKIPELKGYLHEIAPGYYINAKNLSQTDDKISRLMAISNELGLNLKIEKGNFETTDPAVRNPERTRIKKSIRVTFPDGEIIDSGSPQEVFIDCIKKMGVDRIANRKNLNVIHAHPATKRYVEIADHRWVCPPGDYKSVLKSLKVIGLNLGINLQIELISAQEGKDRKRERPTVETPPQIQVIKAPVELSEDSPSAQAPTQEKVVRTPNNDPDGHQYSLDLI